MHNKASVLFGQGTWGAGQLELATKQRSLSALELLLPLPCAGNLIHGPVDH